MVLHAAADSIEDEYVRQVIEEDQQHYGNEYHYEEEPPPQHDPAEEEERRREARERAEKEAADRVAAERERRFEMEMNQMRDEEQKKLARKQKRRDGRIVRSVLRAAGKNDHYGVLGLRGWSLEIPPRTVGVSSSVGFTIPGIPLVKPATDKQIRKQFRNRARKVHPDKNRDGRANEAFVAVEHAASVLSDPDKRRAYDAERKRDRDEKLERYRKLGGNALATAWALAARVFAVGRTLLGPFFVPVVILLALII